MNSKVDLLKPPVDRVRRQDIVSLDFASAPGERLVGAFKIPKRGSHKSDADADMQNCEVTSQTHQIGSSAKPLGPEQSAHLEKIRTILGIWTEPVLVAYGNYTRHPELGPGLVSGPHR